MFLLKHPLVIQPNKQGLFLNNLDSKQLLNISEKRFG